MELQIHIPFFYKKIGGGLFINLVPIITIP
jgi:hypothetical protein